MPLDEWLNSKNIESVTTKFKDINLNVKEYNTNKNGLAILKTGVFNIEVSRDPKSMEFKTLTFKNNMNNEAKFFINDSGIKKMIDTNYQ